jgi:hypothetical protein
LINRRGRGRLKAPLAVTNRNHEQSFESKMGIIASRVKVRIRDVELIE